MRHYLAGRHFDEAMRLLKNRHLAVLATGGLGTLLAWKDAIPEEETRDSASACVVLGAISAWAGQMQEAERLLARAESLFDATSERAASERGRGLRGYACVMRAFAADAAGDTARAIELARAADALLPAGAAIQRNLLLYIFSKAYRDEGDLLQAEKFSNEYGRTVAVFRSTWALAGATHERLLLCRLQGRLREAERLLAEFEAAPRDRGASGPAARIMAHRAEIEREHRSARHGGRVDRGGTAACHGVGAPLRRVLLPPDTGADRAFSGQDPDRGRRARTGRRACSHLAGLCRPVPSHRGRAGARGARQRQAS